MPSVSMIAILYCLGRRWRTELNWFILVSIQHRNFARQRQLTVFLKVIWPGTAWKAHLSVEWGRAVLADYRYMHNRKIIVPRWLFLFRPSEVRRLIGWLRKLVLPRHRLPSSPGSYCSQPFLSFASCPPLSPPLSFDKRASWSLAEASSTPPTQRSETPQSNS